MYIYVSIYIYASLEGEEPCRSDPFLAQWEMVKFLRRQLASPQRSDIAPASNNGSSARVRKDLPKSAREVAGSPPEAEELGDVGEAPYAHRRRHSNYRGRCARCVWYKHEEKWKSTCGSLTEQDRVSPQRCWVQVRPRQLGGTWALGCWVCHLAAQLLQGRPKSNPKQIRMNTKWTKYEIRGNVQAERIREHARSDEHRRSLSVLKNPGSVAGSLEALPRYDDNEGELFAKAVPQLQDWSAAWSACKEDKSWVCAAKDVRLF